jgi:hypothetical protein
MCGFLIRYVLGNHLVDLGVDGKIILERTSGEWSGKAWT